MSDVLQFKVEWIQPYTKDSFMEKSLEIRLLCLIFKMFRFYFFKNNFFVIKIHTSFLSSMPQITNI